ncbi:MAG TPA: VTT domain-containing protein [Candidatus Cybelea sp.]|nr:VTT domain-containing protein [Candidatus Cybelea sp.]
MIAQIADLIATYKYYVILPIALFEAPLMSIVIGFFAASREINLGLAFAIVALGDLIGDTVLYVFGRWCSGWFGRIGPRMKLSPERVREVLEYFGQRDLRAIAISKLVHGVGFTGLIVAGSIRVPYRRFIITCVLVSLAQSVVLVAIGMLSGQAYQSVAHWLGNLDIVIAAVFLIGLFFLYRALIDKVGTGGAKE